MKYIFLMLFPIFAFANTNGADVSASGTVVNNSPYNGVVIDSDMPDTTFTRDMVVCPTAKVDFALLPSFQTNDFMDSQGITAMFSISGPLDLSGIVSRCERQQKMLIRQTQLQAERQARLSSFEILDKCIELKEAGVSLVTVKSFPWAKHCDGVVFNDGVRLQRKITKITKTK